MKLTDLNPEWRELPPGNKYLYFDCPTCATKHREVIAVDNTHFPDQTWHVVGTEQAFERISITPSLQQHCNTSPHYFITNGEIMIV